MLLDLVDDGLVLELRAVGGEVYRLGCFRKDLDFSAGVVVSLLEGCESGCGLAFEAEGGADFGPVDFEGCASLERDCGLVLPSREGRRLETIVE